MHLAKHVCRTLTVFLALSTLLGSVAGTAAAADRRPLVGDAPAPTLPLATAISTTGLLLIIEPFAVQCIQTTTFDDVIPPDPLGLNYDGILPATGVFFAERFVGQELGSIGYFDAVTGTPSNPLTLQVGLPGQNLDVFDYSTNVLVGVGYLGYPEFDAIGEGSISVLFPIGQSQISLAMMGGNGGDATLDFYRADGSLIDTILLSGLADSPFGIATANGEPEITGMLMQSTDAAGIGIDNICHDIAVVKTRTSAWGALKALYR